MIGVTKYRGVPYKNKPWRKLIKMIGIAIKQGAKVELLHYVKPVTIQGALCVDWFDVTITWEPEDAGTEVV